MLWSDDTTLRAEVDEGVVVLGAHRAALEPDVDARDGSLFGEVFAQGIEEGRDALCGFLDVVYRALAYAATRGDAVGTDGFDASLRGLGGEEPCEGAAPYIDDGIYVPTVVHFFCGL